MISAQKHIQDMLRQLPAVMEVDLHLKAARLPYGRGVRQQVLQVLADLRTRILQGRIPLLRRQSALAQIEKALRQSQNSQLRPVINATGVVIHTNLGRAPLPAAWLQQATLLLARYQNLELNLQNGKRGPRGGQAEALLANLAGTQAALVVNNNAAAVLLMLSALACTPRGEARQVVVSRGELVEIGGGFRVPDIMRQSGCQLVEVGTTNRTKAVDYAQALAACPHPAALLKVHRSNFSMQGFVQEPSLAELAAVAQNKGVAFWYDAGAGSFYHFNNPPLRPNLSVAQEIAQGIDVLTFSGDKTLGSVQAGLVVGRQESILAMRQHPLYRTMRVDKVRMVLLEQSLLEFLALKETEPQNITLQLLERTPQEMLPVAQRMAQALEKRLGQNSLLCWHISQENSLTGGGANPETKLPTVCLVLALQAAQTKKKSLPQSPVQSKTPSTQDGEALACALRQHTTPIICRLAKGKVLLDMRTLLEGDEAVVVEALLHIGAQHLSLK